MAFTRKKNSPLEYNLEQNQFNHVNQYIDYKFKNQNPEPALPGFGFTPSKLPGQNLSSNYITIESQLFGINANNLVNPQNKQSPNYTNLPFWDITPKSDAILPKPLVIQRDQRPLYCYKDNCK
tara:strand:+ start:3471 stop:3839 length:369 start_codon:yes stop_codon:yes gene_type:complete